MASASLEALGMIETKGFVALVEACDAMVKARPRGQSTPRRPGSHRPCRDEDRRVALAPFIAIRDHGARVESKWRRDDIGPHRCDGNIR